jgi:Tfp pilus assembly protein PilN
MNMLQQINLYRQFKPSQPLFFSINIVFVFYSIFFCILLLSSLKDYQHVKVLQKQVNSLSAELTVEMTKLEKVKKEYPLVNLSDLEASIQRLKQELGTRGNMLAILSRQGTFTNYLNALANAIIPGVWLTNIQITHYGQDINLQGKATAAPLVHLFLEQLQKQSLFSKMQIEIGEINKSPPGPQVEPYNNFVITAKAGMEP